MGLSPVPVSGRLQYVRVVHVSQNVQRALVWHLQAVRDEDGTPQFEHELPDDGRVGTETAGQALDKHVVALNWHRHAQQHRYHEKLVGLKGKCNVKRIFPAFSNILGEANYL